MHKYLLIESRDPFDSNDVTFSYDLACGLAGAGHEVTLLLVQNGVFAARRGVSAPGLERVQRAGVRVLADDFSLDERGMTPARLAPGITVSPIDVVVDHMAEGHRTLWH